MKRQSGVARVTLVLAAMMLLCGQAMAQAVRAPEGNNLPEPEMPDQMNAPAHGHSHAHRLADDHDHAAHALTPEQVGAFADRVDLSRFRRLAIFDAGRAKVLDTMAREHLSKIYGKARWKDPITDRKYDPVFTFLDMQFNQTYYIDKPVIHVEVLPFRRQMVEAVVAAEQQEKWLKIGRLAPLMFTDPRMQQIIDDSEADLLLSKARNQVLQAWFAFRDDLSDMKLVSPPAGGDHWTRLAEDPRGDSAIVRTGMVPGGGGTETIERVRAEFTRLAHAWHDADADTVNAAMNAIADLLPQVNPQSYPPSWLREAEYLYNATHKFTIGYVVYFVATIALLIAFGVSRLWLIRTGVTLLIIGFVVHSVGFAIRGIISGRWPIHNQFESFMALSWFAVMVGVILMIAKKQWLFGAAAAALGTCSLVIANTVDIPSNEVAQVAGILATSRILYIHVNMVIASYALIALAFFVSLFYLGVYYFQSRSTVQFAAAGLGVVTEGSDAKLPGPQAMLRDLDRAQMIVLQLAFWLLGTGILLGAYWADHAWGRWWAWDPKETWALITWIIYLIVIHVRIVSKAPALNTAWLSVVGFFVMLWTHWGVNLLLAGLHSYA